MRNIYHKSFKIRSNYSKPLYRRGKTLSQSCLKGRMRSKSYQNLEVFINNCSQFELWFISLSRVQFHLLPPFSILTLFPPPSLCFSLLRSYPFPYSVLVLFLTPSYLFLSNSVLFLFTFPSFLSSLKGSDQLGKVVELSMQSCGQILQDLFET